MKVNHSYFRDLGKLIADEIRNRLSKRNPVLDGAVIKYIREICRKTVQDLKVILGELEEFKRKVAPISQAERKNPVFFFTLLNKINVVCLFSNFHQTCSNANFTVATKINKECLI